MSSTHTKVTTFKERFSELSGESEKTITDLAKDLHVSYQTISAWRLGTRSPKEPTIIAIANHFGVDVAWLMGFDVPKVRDAPILTRANSFTEEDRPKNNRVRLLLREFNRMSDEELDRATEMMRLMFARNADHFREDDNET